MASQLCSIFEIPYHTEIMESFDGLDLEAQEELQEMAFII